MTSSISFTLTLALLTFILTQFEGVRRNGLGTYLEFRASGLPAKPIMVPFMAFIELVQEFSKPLTLGMRLYANILAGHLIIFVFLSFILYFGTFMAVISVPAAVVFFAFEIFVAVLQAYIFAILTQVYIELDVPRGSLVAVEGLRERAERSSNAWRYCRCWRYCRERRRVQVCRDRRRRRHGGHRVGHRDGLPHRDDHRAIHRQPEAFDQTRR